LQLNRTLRQSDCEDQRRQTRWGPIASHVTYVVYNMHSRHLHKVK
jgi:hypothetical protein